MTVKKKGCSKKSIFPEELLRKSNCRVEVVILKKWLLWRSSYCEKVASPAIKLFWKIRYISEKGDRHLKGHRNSHGREIARKTENGDSNSHIKLEFTCLIKVFFSRGRPPHVDQYLLAISYEYLSGWPEPTKEEIMLCLSCCLYKFFNVL